MSLEPDLFDKIPSRITRFRYENSLMAIKKRDPDRADFIMKNVDEHSHIHLYGKENDVHMIFTREDRRGKKNEHKSIDINKFLLTLAKVYQTVWMILERIETDDLRFQGCKVTLCSIPQLQFDRIRDRKAYFSHRINKLETSFENIDSYEIGFGCVYDEKNHETDMILTRNGEIYHLNIKELKKITNDPNLKNLF